jgi:hypothetical protein
MSASRDPEVICGAIREVIERHIRIVGRGHDYQRLEELCDELSESLMIRQLETSLRLVSTKGARNSI